MVNESEWTYGNSAQTKVTFSTTNSRSLNLNVSLSHLQRVQVVKNFLIYPDIMGLQVIHPKNLVVASDHRCLMLIRVVEAFEEHGFRHVTFSTNAARHSIAQHTKSDEAEQWAVGLRRHEKGAILGRCPLRILKILKPNVGMIRIFHEVYGRFSKFIRISHWFADKTSIRLDVMEMLGQRQFGFGWTQKCRTHWIGLRENLRETMVFTCFLPLNMGGFL